MTRVAIVGGGIAGLAAAQALRTQAPDAEVIVLEARDRVGGRVANGEVAAGHVVEMGLPGSDRDSGR